MTQVDRITEDIDHMPVAAFIIRDKESDDVQYSSEIRLIYFKEGKEFELKTKLLKDQYVSFYGKKSCGLSYPKILGHVAISVVILENILGKPVKIKKPTTFYIVCLSVPNIEFQVYDSL